MFKALVFGLLLVLSFSYTEEDNVLVLTDEDFPNILSEFSHILIEFYAPWCGHCKKLQPVYKQVAAELKNQQSIVRVAKVDATVEKKAAGQYQVRGFPTLYFFHKGQKIDYSGQRSKDSMVNWLLKKTRDPVVQIDKEGYQKLASAGSVAFVFHGDLSANADANVLNQIAMADDYNTYYWGTELNPECAGVEVVRSFDAAACYPALDDGLKKWIERNQRPLIVEFDERTINDIFSSRKLGCTFFNGANSNEMVEAFNAAAEEYGNSDGEPLIFTSIKADNQHFENLANYIKIKHQKSPLVILDAGNKKKYVYLGEMTKENILGFLNNYSENEYGLSDEVKYEDDGAPTEEEL